MALSDKGAKLDVSRQCQLTDSGTCTTEFIKAAPECRILKWSGETNIGVSYPAVVATLDELSRGQERVKWGSGNLYVEGYTLPPGPGMEDGGLEMEIVLAAIPASNRFEFHIDGATDYDWALQPALTAQQIAQGRIRPDNVIGSYAVYHRAKRDHVTGARNYATGKAFHVYRPKLIDALGVETWGTLEYADGVLTVEIPQDALDKATYPAKVDPTFGYTTIGASSFPFNATLWSHIGTPASNGTVDSVSMYTDSGAGNLKGVIALASTKVIIANGVTPSQANGAAGWQTIAYVTDPSVTGSTAYYVGGIASADIPLFYDSGGTTGQDLYDATNNFTTPEDPTSGSVNDEHPSVYATFTESGGGGRATKNTRAWTHGVNVGMGHRMPV